jgi:hypothetical protein
VGLANGGMDPMGSAGIQMPTPGARVA